MSASAQVPGGLDLTFGGNARVRTNFNSKVLTNAGGWDAVVQAPNSPLNANYRKIVVVGSSAEGTRPHFAVIRLNPNGSRDMGFGIANPTNDADGAIENDGVVKEIDLGTWDTLTDVVMLSDNSFVVLGYISKIGGGEDWRLIKYTQNGERDTTFGNSNPKDGMVTFDGIFAGTGMTGARRTRDLAVDSQDRIYAAGYANDGSQADMFIFRLSSTGAFDSTWNAGIGGVSGAPGMVRVAGSSQDQAWGVRVQKLGTNAGKVVVAGRQNNQPVLLRLNSNGTLDTTFASSGYTYLSTGGGSDFYRGMDVDSQDRIVPVGKYVGNICGDNRTTTFGVVARYTPNGALDSTFSGGDSTVGWLRVPVGTLSNFEDVEVMTNGKIVITGETDFNGCGVNDFRLMAVRIDDNGALDTTFSGDGIVDINANPNNHEQSHGIAIQPDGDILIPAEGYAGNLEHMMVARVNGDDPDGAGPLTAGMLDTTFNTAGQVLTSSINVPGIFATRLTGGSADYAYGLAIQSDGAVLQVGQTWNGWDYDFGVNKISALGLLDVLWGDRPPSSDAAFQDPNRKSGKVVIDIGSAGVNDNTDVAYATVIQSTGKAVVVGTTQAGNGLTQVRVFRLNADGTPDGTFTSTTTDFSGGNGNRPRAAIIDSSDRIYVVGEVYGGGYSNLLLVRYGANGGVNFSTTFNYKGASNFEEGHSLAFQKDGKLVIGGRYSAAGGQFQMYVGRFNVNEGSPGSFTVDNTFAMGRVWDDTNKVVGAHADYTGLFPIPHEQRNLPTQAVQNPSSTALTVMDEATAIVVETDQRITLAGRSTPTGAGKRPRYTAVRLMPSGWIDTTFGSSGWVSTYFPGGTEDSNHDSAVAALVLQADGKLVAAGTEGSLYNPNAVPPTIQNLDFAAARYNWNNGALDSLFDSDGKISIAVGKSDDIATSAKIHTDGRTVIGGYDNLREDFLAVRLQGDAAPHGIPPNAPNLIDASDSYRPDYVNVGATDNITNDNTPSFSANGACVAGETILMKIVGQNPVGDHPFVARYLCPDGTTSAKTSYTATVPGYPAVGGSAIYGQNMIGQLPDGLYDVSSRSATGAGITGVSPYLNNLRIDTRADFPTITHPTLTPIEKKNAEEAILFGGANAEAGSNVTVYDTTSVVWNATTGRITSGTPSAICSQLNAPNGTWSCQAPAHPAAGALSLGLHKVKPQQHDIANNLSELCIVPGLTKFETCTAQTQFYVKAITTTTAVSSKNPTVYGEPVTLTTQVRANVGIPFGQVVMTYDSVARPAQTLDATGDASFSPTLPLSVGNHTLTATFAETDQYFPSQTGSTLTQVVNKADTSVTPSSSANPSVYGQSVTISAVIDVVAPGNKTSVACPACANPTGSVEVSIDGGTAVPATTFANGTATFVTSALSVGDHTFVFTYSGDGNFKTSSNTAFTQTVNKGSTATAIVSSQNPSVFGQSVTFTATVTAVSPAAGTRTGTVDFKDGANAIATCSGVSINASGVATCTTTALSVASHPITADYSGDGNFLASTITLSDQAVNKANTSTALTSSKSPSTYGEEITLTGTVAAVAPGAGTPSGTIEFRSDGNTIASCTTQTMSGSAIATCSTTVLAAGARSLTAVYSSDASFNTSTSGSLSQTVNKANTTTTLTSDVNPTASGQPVTFTAVVAAVAPGFGEPTGTVQFRDGGTAINCDTQALNSGTAMCVVSTLTPGSHTISAVYSNDSNFNASTATTLSHTVNKGDSLIVVTSTPNPSLIGQEATFTATVTAVSPAVGTPAGLVTFTEGGTDITSCKDVSLNNDGAVECKLSNLSLGTHAIAARYVGDSSFNGSTATDYSHVVDKATTATALAASTAPTVWGQAVTFTATISVAPPGTGTPNGTYSFEAGNVTIAGCEEVSLASGQASCTASGLSAGSHVIKATYSGSSTFLTSNATLNHAVNKADVSTTLSASKNPSTYGESITITATSLAVAPGAGTPTGTVQFMAGNFQIPGCEAKAMTAGVATCVTSALAAGTDPLIGFYSGDGNFNVATAPQLPHTVDKSNTTTALTSDANPSASGQPVTLTAAVTAVAPGTGVPTGTVQFLDGGSAINCDAQAMSNGSATCVISSLAPGSHTITAVYSNDSNFNASTATALTQVVNKGNSSAALASSANPSVTGQDVVFTATVSAVSPAVGAPTGLVTFSRGGNDIATCTNLSLADQTASCVVSGLTVGSHTIAVRYAGDSNFNTSSSSNLTQTVDKGSTGTSAISSQNPSVFGESVTFTATVSAASPASGTRTGSVDFKDGATVIAGCDDVAINASGVATCTTSAFSVANHPVTAVYSGDGNFLTSTGTVESGQVVNKASTSSSITSSKSPSVFGEEITLTATLAVVAPGAGTPSGTFSFRTEQAAITTCTAQPIVAGVATCKTREIATGTDALTAMYSGDASFNSSQTAGVLQTVNKSNTTTTLTSDANPSASGQPVTFTALVAAVSPGAGVPTGTVQFRDGGSSINCESQTMTSGSATCVIGSLAPGSHTISAVYSNDANFNASTASTVTQVVNKGNSSTVVTSSPNPSITGQEITFTVTVSPVSPSLGTPGGLVTFTNNGNDITSCKDVALSSATADCKVTISAIGTYTIGVRYGGDSNFNTSTSPDHSHVVNKATTATTLTSSLNPSVFGQSVTYTATISVLPPGTGIPTGTYNFTDDGTTIPGCGTVGLSAGVATCTTSGSSGGANAIEAIYSGSDDYQQSTGTLTQSVTKGSTTTALTSSLNPAFAGQTVTLTATVSVVAPAVGTRTGAINFRSGASSISGCDSQSVNASGVATCVTSTLSIDTHSITAVYGGDGNFATSTSTAVSQVVNAVQTSTALGASTNPSTFSQNVVFTATVTDTAPGTNTPTGNVSFSDGGAPLCVTALTNGTATCAASTLSPGTHAIVATYQASSIYAGSVSTTINQVVSKATTATTLVTSANPNVFGNPVTFTATVAPVSPASGTPTGSVVFKLNGSPVSGCDPKTLSNGTASCTTTISPVGNYSATVEYSSDTNYSASTSAPLTQVVGAATTATSLASSGSPSVFGQSVTFSATVVANPAAAGTPNGGTVEFKNGGVTIGGCSARPVNGGIATCSTTFTTVATHAITAAFSGTETFNASTAVVFNHPVNRAGTTTALATSNANSVFGQSVMFTATITANAPGAGVPAGTVEFRDGGNVICAGSTMTNGAASCTTSSLTTGSHQITATYSGDINFTVSTAPALTQSVGAASTTVAVGSSLNPTATGQNVTFTATVTANPPGSGTPEGTVTFNDGGTPICANVSLTNGSAACSIATLTSGLHSITASYAGTSDFTTSLSSVFTQMVGLSGAPTFLVRDINTGTSNSSPTSITAMPDGRAVFSAAGPGGIEPWVSDGTTDGTALLKDVDIGSGSSSPANFIVFNNALFFAATTAANGTELWKSDGTTAGTALFNDINAGGASSSPASLAVSNNILFFAAADSTNGSELWKTTGTSGSTARVRDIEAGPGSSTPAALTDAAGTLFFSAAQAATGRELWRSNGSDAGTTLVSDVDLLATSSNPRELLNAAGTVFFVADGTAGAGELWTSNGTTATRARDINPSGADRVNGLVALGSSVLFSANDGVNGDELWSSNGTSGGTQLVKNFTAGSASSLTNFKGVVASGFVYFAANDGTSGVELWKSDGTTAGTTRVQDICPGACSSNPTELTTTGNKVFFTATNALVGTEFWVTDGTVAGTQLVADLANGSGHSSPEQVRKVGNLLYFAATTPAAGKELYVTCTTNTTRLALTGPSSLIAGTASSLNLSALDASNLLVPCYSGTVHFTSTDPLATLPSNFAFSAGLGKRDFAFTLATPGTQTITATDIATSSILGTLTITIKGTTTTTLTSSANPSASGESITFTATVAPTPNGAVTGTVTFRDGATTLGTSTLDNGVATHTTSTLASGTHTITASYSGDAKYNASDSSTLSQAISGTTIGAPVNFTASALNTQQISFNWTAVAGAITYEVHRSRSVTGPFEVAAVTNATSAADSLPIAENTTYIYKVRVISGTTSPFSPVDVATTTMFTDPVLTGVFIKAAHVEQLRTAVDAMRAAANLSAASFTDFPLSGVMIKRLHITELRTALNAARAAIGLTPISYVDPAITAGVTSMKKEHITDLRNGTQ